MAKVIKTIKIRAKIEGDKFSVQTPYIHQFSVTKRRGQMSSFSAVLKISPIEAKDVGGDIVIHSGVEGSMEKIFTGIITRAVVSPCWDDPSYIMLNISGYDCLYKIKDVKYSRRLSDSRISWATIDGVVNRRLKSGKFKYANESILAFEQEALRDQNIMNGMPPEFIKELGEAISSDKPPENVFLNINKIDSTPTTVGA